MLISYNWLQRYFDAKLPTPKEIADKLIFHSFEVEGIEAKDDDTVLDIKVLPDRAHDCLCHYGIAKEVSTLFNLEAKTPFVEVNHLAKVRDLKIKIEEPKLCRRYIGRVVENIEIKDSPAWLKAGLEKLEQRSIFNIVDVANYIMFDVGQPLHAFDADKIVGGITVRLARVGEKIITLDNQEVKLDENILIIADDEGPLAIAGVKGGKRAEVTQGTKNLILESANFEPVNIRKTAQKIGLRTDASKRFENELSTEVASYAMDLLTDLIVKEAGIAETKVGEKIDEYKNKNIPTSIEFEIKEFVERLGVEIPNEQVTKILESLGIKTELNGNKIKVTPPAERLDLQAKENYVEEVGRIYGYEKITVKTIARGLASGRITEAERRFNIANRIKTLLKAEGFTEVYGYSFTDGGELELANPLTSDKKFLRTSLTDWLKDKIAFNLPYILFDDEAIKIFEIGKIFVDNQEKTMLGMGIAYRKKIKGQSAKEELEKVLEKLELKSTGGGDEILAVQELNFDKIAGEIKDVEIVKSENLVNKEATYKIVSPYPRIIRDVAVWVPENTETDGVAKIIKNSAGELCIEGPILFDEFTKEGRKSLAFRLVFQSYTKTLSDDEANTQMGPIIKALEGQNGFEVRK